MSVRPSPIGYSLFDLLTRILPGLTVMVPVAIWVSTSGMQFGLDDHSVLLLLALGGFLIGETINIIRSALFRVPVPFKQVIYHFTGDEQVLSRWDKFDLAVERRLPESLKTRLVTGGVGRPTVFESTDRNFRSHFEDHFALNFEKDKPVLLYTTFLSYMDSRMSTRTRRLYVLRIFAQNLMVAALLTAGVSAIVAVQSFPQPRSLIAVLSIFILFFIFEMGMLFSTVGFRLVDNLIVDYYVDQLSY